MKYFASFRDRQMEIRLSQREGGQFEVESDGVSWQVSATQIAPGRYVVLSGTKSFVVSITEGPDGYDVRVPGGFMSIRVFSERQARAAQRGVGTRKGSRNVTVSMPGRVVKILVQEGQPVKPGDGLLIIEAMKMENELKAPHDAVVKKIHVQEGQTVEAQEELISFE